MNAFEYVKMTPAIDTDTLDNVVMTIKEDNCIISLPLQNIAVTMKEQCKPPEKRRSRLSARNLDSLCCSPPQKIHHDVPPGLPSRALSPVPVGGRKTFGKKMPAAVFEMMDKMLEDEDAFADEESDSGYDYDDCSTASADSYLSLTFGNECFENVFELDSDDDSSFSSSSSFSYDDIDGDSMSLVEQNCQQELSPSTAKRFVRFAPLQFSQVLEIPHIDDYSDSEWNAMFLSRNELKRIRNDLHLNVREMERNILRKSSSSSSLLHMRRTGDARLEEMRGLEKHTASSNARVAETVDMLYASVFKVQNLRLPPGMIDKEGTIADICQNISRDFILEAHETALLDARASALERQNFFAADRIIVKQ